MITFRLIIVTLLVIVLLQSSLARKRKGRRNPSTRDHDGTDEDHGDKHEHDQDEKGSDEGSNEGPSDMDDLLDNLDIDEDKNVDDTKISLEQPEDDDRFDEILHPEEGPEPDDELPITEEKEEEEEAGNDVRDVSAAATKDLSIKSEEHDKDNTDEGNDPMSNESYNLKEPDDEDDFHVPVASQGSQHLGSHEKSHETKSKEKHESQEHKDHKSHETHEEVESPTSNEVIKIPSFEIDKKSVKVDCEMGEWEEWVYSNALKEKGGNVGIQIVGNVKGLERRLLSKSAKMVGIVLVKMNMTGRRRKSVVDLAVELG